MVTTEMVVAREGARRAALIAGDREAMAEILADRLIWTHANGRVDTKESYLPSVSVSAFRVIDPIAQNIALLGSAAVVKSEFAMTIHPPGKEPVALRTFALGVWALGDDEVLRLTHFQSGIMG
ncbi:nuclear transport factor 2 family protein [Sphingomonas sp. ID0503]|uniref:nuclear transport factor 2 family protein n=1 Tax=Sphingomonas sp. ID0503 TaxID=3399691 RepID=UPI003AFB5048